MKIQKAREHLLKAKSVVISGSVKGFILDTDDFTAILLLLREVEDNGPVSIL